MIESPEFEPLDFGRLNYAGDYTGDPRITYRETRPGRLFRSYSFSANVNNYWYFDTDLGVRQHARQQREPHVPELLGRRRSTSTRYLRGQDAQLTRGGPADGDAARLERHRASLRNSGGAHDALERQRVAADERVRRSRAGASSGACQRGPRRRCSSRSRPSTSSRTGRPRSAAPINRQYVTTLAGGRPETYDRRYVFGLIDRTTLSTQFRVSYTFKPDVNLDVYAEPFAASGLYSGFGELAVARGRDLRMYGTDGTTITRLPGRQLAGDRRRRQLHAVRTATSTSALPEQRRAALGVAAGQHFYLVWQQSRGGREPTIAPSASAISLARCRRRAITYWP